MSAYLVIFERGPESWGAYSPDLPGCVAVGDTRDAVEASMRESIMLYLAELREMGQPIPEPANEAGYIAA